VSLAPIVFFVSTLDALTSTSAFSHQVTASREPKVVKLTLPDRMENRRDGMRMRGIGGSTGAEIAFSIGRHDSFSGSPQQLMGRQPIVDRPYRIDLQWSRLRIGAQPPQPPVLELQVIEPLGQISET